MKKNQKGLALSASKGFTLIELLVVIAIIGLLSTLAVVALTSARAKARDAKRISDVKQVQTALELYFAEKGGKYPEATLSLGDSTLASSLCELGLTGSTSTAECVSGTNTMFMGKVPRDPSQSGGVTACTDAADKDTRCDYAYTSEDPSTTYSIIFSLEGGSGDLTAGANCATQDGMGACS